MTRLALLLALAGLTACAPRARSGGAPFQATFVSYNIHAGKDADAQPNLERVAALLDSLGAEVALLQEVDRGTRRSGGEDQLAELERRTGMSGVFGKSLDYDGGEYGIAVLSRWPVREATVVPLSVQPPQERAGGAHEPRVALHVVLASPAGPLHVINTHLDPGRSGTYRQQEMIGLLAHVRRAAPAAEPLVLGGDLNARPDTDEIAALGLALADAWTECGGGDGATFPASGPDRRIDYLLLRGARCATAAVPDSRASDHRPLVVELVLPARDSL